MTILSKLKAKKLTSQITCTSYYDFLTCGHHCLESLDCRNIPSDPPIQKELKRPPGLPKHGVKYFGVDDNAAEWYLDTRALKVKKPLLCRRKFCFRFRVPIRSAKAATYSVPGRRVSPEFLSLLKQDHARKPGLEKLPHKYRSRKPSFSSYKYDAEGKRREMRPGIDTAAPLEFPNRDVTCTCVSPMERDLMAYRRHSSRGPRKMEEDSKPSGLYPLSARTKRNRKRSVHFERDKGVGEDTYKDMEQENQCQCLKNLQDRDNLQENVANQDKAGLSPMYNPMNQPLQFHGPPKPPACSSQPTFNPTKNITNGTCPFGQQGTGCLRSCDHSKCPSRQWRFGRYRDPCSVEYQNSPFFKAIQGSSYGGCSRNGSAKPRNCSQCISENINITKMCAACKEKTLEGSGNKEQSEIEVQAPPENSCYAPPVSYHRQLGVDCSQRAHLTAENGLEIPGNSSGYKGFVHRSEKQKMLDQDGAINTQKPKPCCHLFPSVDPDTRQAEMERLAKLKFSETNPDSCNWSKGNRDIWEQGKSRLAENDEKKPSQNPISSCFGPDKSKATCPCKNPSCPQSVGKHSSESCPKTLRKCDTRSAEQIGSYTLLSQAKEPPQPPQPEKSSGESPKKLVSILKKTTTDWERTIPKKARLFPRLHAFAKRFLWSGPKSHRLKSDKSDNERSDNYSVCRKVDKSNPYCIRHLSSDDSDARQRRSTKAEHVKFDFSEQENQAISSVIKRTTFQDQARIQDVRGPRDTSLWTKFHQAKPRQKSSSPEIYRNARPRRNEASKATRPDPNRLDSRSRKRSNTPLSSSPERGSNKRPRYPRQKALVSPNRAQTPRTYEKPCSAECAQKARNYRRVQGNGITSPGIQDRATSRFHDNEELVSSSGYETPHERHRCRGPQQRISRVQLEVQKKTKKRCAGCKSCNHYLNTSRASESSCPRYRRETVPYSHTESQAKSTKPSSSQPRGYRSPVSKDQENSPRRLQIKRRHCDQTCLAQTVSKPCKVLCQSRRMRGGIDYREDDYIPGSNQDVPHSFPTNLPADTDSYRQQVNYTKACKSSMHAFCFD